MFKGVAMGSRSFPGGSVVKTPHQCRRPGFDPWVGKSPWRRKWQPPPAFLPGGSHGQRGLAGYSPRGHKSRQGWVTKQGVMASRALPASAAGHHLAAWAPGNAPSSEGRLQVSRPSQPTQGM